MCSRIGGSLTTNTTPYSSGTSDSGGDGGLRSARIGGSRTVCGPVWEAPGGGGAEGRGGAYMHLYAGMPLHTLCGGIYTFGLRFIPRRVSGKQGTPLRFNVFIWVALRGRPADEDACYKNACYKIVCYMPFGPALTSAGVMSNSK